MLLSILALLACGSDPAPPPAEALAVLELAPPPPPGAVEGMAIAISVPLTGPSAAIGKAAVQGARLAMPSGIDLIEIDEQLGDPVPQAIDDPRVIGVVAHVTAIGAQRWAAGWLEHDVAVVLAAPATVPGLPRVLAGARRHVQCATAFLGPGKLMVAHDGTPEANEVANEADRLLVQRSFGVRAVDPMLVAGEASRVQSSGADWLVYAGDPANGGNLLRAVRQLGGDIKLLGLGLYDPRFVTAAGEAGEGSVLTSQDRPILNDKVLRRWQAAYGGEPPAVALNAYDATRLLVEAWGTATVASKSELRGAVRGRLMEVEIDGAAGPLRLDDEGVADPSWCTAFEVKDGALSWMGAASVSAGKVVRLPDEAEARTER